MAGLEAFSDCFGITVNLVVGDTKAIYEKLYLEASAVTSKEVCTKGSICLLVQSTGSKNKVKYCHCDLLLPAWDLYRMANDYRCPLAPSAMIPMSLREGNQRYVLVQCIVTDRSLC